MAACSRSRAFTSDEVIELVPITYRQLDHWARRRWVIPSIDAGLGRAGRRQFSPADLLHVAALRHFASSGWPVSAVGDMMGQLNIGASRFVTVGSRSAITVCRDSEELFEHLQRQPQKITVFDTMPLRTQIGFA